MHRFCSDTYCRSELNRFDSLPSGSGQHEVLCVASILMEILLFRRLMSRLLFHSCNLKANKKLSIQTKLHVDIDDCME